MNETILQGLIRFGRTVGAAAVSAALLGAGDLIIDLNLGPQWGPIVLIMLTAILNALGKFLRGPDAPVDAVVAERVRGARAPIRQRNVAFFLPI